MFMSAVFVTNTKAQNDDPNTTFNDQQLRLIKKGPKIFAAYQKAYQEKNGALLWNLWVKVSLKFLKRSVVPTRPLDLKIRMSE